MLNSIMLNQLNSRFEKAEYAIREPKYRSIETIQSEKEKKNEEKSTEPQSCGTS